jgi:hypothetical protein
VQPSHLRFEWLVLVLAVATGCQSEASARATSAIEVAQVFDSLETINRATESLLDSARSQLDSALQTMVEIATVTDRLAGEPVSVVASTQGELPAARSDLVALRSRSLARLDVIQGRLRNLEASLRTVRDTSKKLREEVSRLSNTVRSLTRATGAHEARLKRLSLELKQVETERDHAIATSAKYKARADTLHEVLAYTIETNRAKDDSVFVLVGDAEHLEDIGVAERTGGMIGFGRVLKLRGNFPREEFMVASRHETTTFPMPIARREYRLLSAQRPECYSWTTNADSVAVLKVLDPDCFWESSRYLVIEERK